MKYAKAAAPVANKTSININHRRMRIPAERRDAGMPVTVIVLMGNSILGEIGRLHKYTQEGFQFPSCLVPFVLNESKSR